MYYDDGPINSVLRVSYYGRGVWETPMHPVSSGINSGPTPLLVLEVSPNPSTEAITVTLPLVRDENSSVQITNSIGQIVFEMKCPSAIQEKMKIEIPQLPAGVYLIQLLNSKNNIYANGKFVKN
ncbi:MAG: T9SS type A sorting domain-containing protein [Bacteroidetes bacterium]|nr:T9SS type A sorting domain-containing protein [Bacteroidota bacterium]